MGRNDPKNRKKPYPKAGDNSCSDMNTPIQVRFIKPKTE